MKSLIIVLVLFSSSIYGQDVREIINRYLDTVSNGNIDNWKKIKSVYSEYESYYSQRDSEQKIHFLQPEKPSFCKSYQLVPYRHRIDRYEDSTYTHLKSTFYFLKDKTIILIGNIPPMIKKNPAPHSEFFSEHTPVFIWNLVNKSRSTELMGIKEFPIDGLLCYEIKITTKAQDYYLYINTETFLLEYWNVNKEGDPTSLVRFYNYKQIDDFLIPMSTSSMRNGFVFHWVNNRKIEFNTDIDPEHFIYKGKY